MTMLINNILPLWITKFSALKSAKEAELAKELISKAGQKKHKSLKGK